MSAAVASAPAEVPSAARRRSGRVSKKPDRLADVATTSTTTKRKRRENDDDSGVEADDASSDEQSEQSSSEGEPDEEEVRERRRKQKTRGATAKRPATKKPKTNGQTVSLAIRPAGGAPRKAPKKPRKAGVRKSAIGEDEPEGLYADVFGSGVRLDDVAASWIARFNEHEARAVAEIINLVLRASGCDIRIDEDDVADPDNAPNRVAEIQEDFQTHDVTEYPLIAKAKDGGGQAFRNALHGFFSTLVETIAETGLLYENMELLENISVWLAAMSSTGNRPFRHTSTVASLAITSGLATVAADIVENTAKRIRQSEAESKKSRVNKARVSAADQEVEEYNQKLQIVDNALKDWFDTIYTHRFRDVDPRIRVDCIHALTDWIITYPDKFFDGTHLRHLGWILSDPNGHTRVEVLHQLAKLFRDENKLAGLKTFTERYRPRIVEMATRDAENNVRAAAVDLLDILREAGFLEPDDIDSVGKLIFDTDAKVRKSVVSFFAENVNAAYDAIVEDMGGEEALSEALAPADEDDEEYHNPRLEWLKLKCLVEQLLAYDENEAGFPSQIEHIVSSGAELGLASAGVESRFSLVAQALYDVIPEIRSWEVLAGYLLYDHSQAVQNGAGEDAEALLRQNCQLEERHETVLLDMMNAVVRIRLQRLAEASTDKKKTKAQRESEKEDQADMARRLALLIPQLLKKFGALPEAAALCLRLERELNLEVFEELRQNAALTALLDDINKQFLTHHNERVLSEAINSILHAQGNDELKEVIDLKVQALWDDLISTFDALRRDKDFSRRGNLGPNILSGVSNVVLKMAQLAKASDASVLENIPTPAKSKGKAKKKALDTPPISSLLDILNRGVPTRNTAGATDDTEDVLVQRALALMLIYFLWKCRDCAAHIEAGTTLPDETLTALAERRDTCITSLMRIMSARKGADPVRLAAANLLLDIYTMFRTLKAKHGHPPKTPKKAQGRASTSQVQEEDWESLIRQIDTPTTRTLLSILAAAESHLAKLTHKRLDPDPTAIDAEPVDPDDEPVSDSDSDLEDAADDGTDAANTKQIRALLAERALCSFGARLVQAVQGGALGGKEAGAVREALERNAVRLAGTWREIVGFLEGRGRRGGAGKKGGKGKVAREVVEVVEEEVEDSSAEEEQEEEQGEGEGEKEGDEDEEMHDDEEVEVNGEAADDAEPLDDGDEDIIGD